MLSKNLPYTIKNCLGKKPINVSWKRNKVQASLSQFVPNGMKDYRIAYAIKKIIADIANDFLSNPPQPYKKRDFNLRVDSCGKLFSSFISSIPYYWKEPDEFLFKLITFVRNNLTLDLEHTLIEACPQFNEDESLNEDLTFWELVDQANLYLSKIECSERLKTQVKSMLLEHYLLPKEEREKRAKEDRYWFSYLV